MQREEVSALDDKKSTSEKDSNNGNHASYLRYEHATFLVTIFQGLVSEVN